MALNLYITGFGKFGDIHVNPTSILVESLQKLQSENKLSFDGIKIHNLEVLEVSI